MRVGPGNNKRQVLWSSQITESKYYVNLVVTSFQFGFTWQPVKNQA